MTIFKKKPEYADTVYGDSCIVAESILEDATKTNITTTLSSVIFSVISATGEFEGVSGLEVINNPDGKRKFVLKWNGDI
jgi:hypothetical protein